MRKYTIGLITGALLAVSAMMFMGSQKKNMGHIVVNSIYVANEDGNTVAKLFAGEEGGFLRIYNNDGNTVAALAAGEYGGILEIYNNDEKLAAGITADENGGNLEIYNKHKKQVATLQSNKNNDGAIGLYDRYGDLGWGETGKQ